MACEGFRWVVVVALVVPSFGCERDPLDVECPEVGPGGLVITEVRGDQDGADDSQGEWIELFNASGSTIDLVGLRIVMKTLNGSSVEDFTVRRSVPVAAGAYVTLGNFPDGQEPSHVDYGYSDEFDGSINSTGAIEAIACGVEIDQVVYQSLPGNGTLSFDGAVQPPDAGENDKETSFCIDANGAGEGSPQQENPPCA